MLNPAQEKGLRDKLANEISHIEGYQAWIDGALATINTYTALKEEALEIRKELKKLLFGFDNLSVKPAEVAPDKPVTISIDVANLSSVPDSCCLTLKVNGEFEGEREIKPLESGETRTESHQISRHELGTYDIDINGQIGSLNVRRA